METAVRSKICWGCDGRVSFHESTCPFCGLSLESMGDRVVPLPLDPLKESLKMGAVGDFDLSPSRDPLSSSEQIGYSLASLLGAVGGSTLLLFTAGLFLFSRDGKLTLSWDASLWPVTLLGSMSLLFLAYKIEKKF